MSDTSRRDFIHVSGTLALLAATARATGDETTALGLLHASRDIRSAIGDAGGLAECDAELAQMAAPT